MGTKEGKFHPTDPQFRSSAHAHCVLGHMTNEEKKTLDLLPSEGDFTAEHLFFVVH